MKDIKIIVAAATLTGDQSYDDDDCDRDVHLEQQIYSLEELLEVGWFVDLLKNKGFYSKDELSLTKDEYLNNFVYEYGSGPYTYFTKSINDIQSYQIINKVYQEVIGRERIKSFAKWKQKQESYLKKEAERVKKDVESKEKARQKKKLKALEKARKLLEETENGVA